MIFASDVIGALDSCTNCKRNVVIVWQAVENSDDLMSDSMTVITDPGSLYLMKLLVYVNIETTQQHFTKYLDFLDLWKCFRLDDIT